MKCIHCKGEMKKGAAPFYIDRKGWRLVLDTVPAWICIQCGEVYFEGKEIDAIQDLITVVERKTERMAMTG